MTEDRRGIIRNAHRPSIRRPCPPGGTNERVGLLRCADRTFSVERWLVASEFSLPRKVGNTEPGQRAAKVLHLAAEHGGPFIFMARINFYRAVYGDEPHPIGNPESKKGHRWGKRKLARDR